MPNPIPLCVDLDGTLLATDLLWESLRQFLKDKPYEAWKVFLWLLRGRAHLKRELAVQSNLNVARLPYRQEVVSFVNSEFKAGREVQLVTASDKLLAEQVQKHLGCFTGVIASDGIINLKGDIKRVALEKRFGRKGFDYIGDHPADRPVWESAQNALVVAGSEDAARSLAKPNPVFRAFLRPDTTLHTIGKAIRVHQWSKNVLVFVPAICGHRFHDITVLSKGVIAFFAFSFIASSVYLINDLTDVDSDRNHPTKHNRPLASGMLSFPLAVGVALTCLLLGSLLASLCNGDFFSILATYYILSFIYSWFFKTKLMLDVMILAGFYTLRLFGGATATNIQLSVWLLAFSMFFFFSLAMVKRYSELIALEGRGVTNSHGRRYALLDIPQVGALGISSGLISVLVLALYVLSPEVTILYKHPPILLLLCPLLMYWIGRLWLLPQRGLMNEDPVVFALSDFGSYVVGFLGVVITYFATVLIQPFNLAGKPQDCISRWFAHQNIEAANDQAPRY